MASTRSQNHIQNLRNTNTNNDKKLPKCFLLYLIFLVAGIFTNAQAASLQGLDHPDIIPGQYVVVLKSAATLAARTTQEKKSTLSAESMAKKNGFNIKHRFHSSFNGFTLKLAGVAMQAQHTQQLQALLDNPEVAFIEADRRIYLEPRREDLSLNSIQKLLPSLWGLDRINQPFLPLDYTYSFNATGKNVHAYLIDSGINREHKEFTGRLATGMNFVGDGEGENDCNGHGTHVAGILGGTTFGAAKNVTLHPVRVFGCDESAEYSAIIAAVEWVIDHHQPPALINMSLGGPRFIALNTAVENAIASGIVVVTAAGNLATDACNTSPAGSANVIAVGSSTIVDNRSSFSNIGKCLTIFAPGTDIISAWIPGTQAETQMSGTSMAAPYVAGVVARYLEKNPTASPAKIKTALQNGGTRNVLSDIGDGSPNLLLNSEVDLETAADTAWQRTLVFIYGQTQPGQDMFIRGGIDHNFALNSLHIDCSKDNMRCAIPIRHLNLRNATTEPWKRNDLHLDWYGTELNQDGRSQGSALDWTTNAWSAHWGPAYNVAEHGYGETSFNQWGNHYWMLDIEMDCTKTVNGWFELKSFISNGPGWEADINQANTPYASKNHFAQCGKLNVFMRGQNNPVAIKDIY